MAVNWLEDTELNDVLRKHGIIPELPKPPRTPTPPPPPTLRESIEDLTPDELKDLAEDTNNEEDERVIEEYRRQRMQEMYMEQHAARFGSVIPISREDYTREVNDASRTDESADEDKKGKGTGVICFLYKDGIPASERTFMHIRTLAQRYPKTKFVSIVGDKCIQNYPDRHLPTIFIYRNGNIVNQQTAWGVDKERKLEELEALLVLTGAITPKRLPPTQRSRTDNDDDLDDDDDDDDGASRRPATTARNGTIRTSAPKDDDDDSDFDL